MLLTAVLVALMVGYLAAATPLGDSTSPSINDTNTANTANTEGSFPDSCGTVQLEPDGNGAQYTIYVSDNNCQMSPIRYSDGSLAPMQFHRIGQCTCQFWFAFGECKWPPSVDSYVGPIFGPNAAALAYKCQHF